MIGKTIGTYRIESLLSGKGGMGRVYLAHHIHLKTPAAIKVIHTHLTENEDFRERFRREALSLYQLVQHPGIVRFFDYIEDDNAQYIITEYVEGDNLADYVKKNGAMSVEKLQNVFRQVLDILGVVHQKGIIHRDLKPANIMLTPTGEVKLLDFGIAKISADNLTATGTSIGTVMYMSPERIYPTKDSNGKPLPLDIRSDIYSLGVTIMEAAIGQSPYATRNTATSEYEVMMNIVTKPLPRLSEFGYQGTPLLQQIIDHATQKEREKRYPNCAAMKADLEQLTNKVNNVSPAPSKSQTPPIPPPQVKKVQDAPPPPAANNKPPANKPLQPAQQQTSTAIPATNTSNENFSDWWLLLFTILVLMGGYWVLSDFWSDNSSKKSDIVSISNFPKTEAGFKQYLIAYYGAMQDKQAATVLSYYVKRPDRYFDYHQPSHVQMRESLQTVFKQYPNRQYQIDWSNFGYAILDRDYYILDYTLVVLDNVQSKVRRQRLTMTLTQNGEIYKLESKD